ncbi:MAG TPA: WecB/TagA/CpsF family glycosyltransferase [Chthoniobacterales bacterium]|nr:WecB/TagA/CpsF family glycosyltransferase [Chthoniobacterales bacterium]
MRILGLDFFEGLVSSAVDRAMSGGGLIVAPSGTCFTRLQTDRVYRAAMLRADVVLPDSGLMVSLWRSLRGQSINRISGLAYLKELLDRPRFRQASVVWVLPDESARDVALFWLRDHGFSSSATGSYVAPMYGSTVEDRSLLALIEEARPDHVVIGLSGGVQEKLAAFLRDAAAQQPAMAIHCIGAALGFVTGYQVAIPDWADRLYLGWSIRLLANPRRFLPRALSAFALPGMIRKYGEAMPPMKDGAQ